MPKLARLYLDTARLGLMSPSAQLAARDFARLAGEGVSTLYFQNLLRDGRHVLRAESPVFLPEMAGWPGIGGLSQLFREFLGLPQCAPVLFASRSTFLMRFAARQLWSRCQRLLVPDTVWPPYLRILEEERLQGGGILIPIPIRDDVLRGQIDAGNLIFRLVTAFDHHRCDGLFLAAISHDGVRIPAAPLLAAIRRQRELRMAVIDGAQELAHAPANLAAAGCDIHLAGCHKWLGAHQPLGVAFLANPNSAAALQDAIVADCRTLLNDDPLLRFLLNLEGQEVEDVPETVNLAPLFTAWGALLDIEPSPESQQRRFAIRQQNASCLAATAVKCGWTPRLPHPSLRTGILLLQSTHEADCQLPSRDLELIMAERRVTLTGLGNGLLRLALPDKLLKTDELEHIVGPGKNVFTNPLVQQPSFLTPVSHPE